MGSFPSSLFAFQPSFKIFISIFLSVLVTFALHTLE